MKTLKFDHQTAQLILQGKKNSTWRLFDDKDLSVNDEVRIIDKVNADDPSSWLALGAARITEVVEKRFEDISEQNVGKDHDYISKKEMLKTYRKFYGSKVTGATPVKIVYFDFEPGSSRGGGVVLEEAKLYTDGGSRGNPGPSACAYVICNLDDNVVEKSGFYMGASTNNKAEYQGLRLGLERAQELGIKKLDVFMDSQLVAYQMKGIYKVKNADLAAVHQEATALSKLFENVKFTYIPRELNKLADSEVNRILDEQNAV